MEVVWKFSVTHQISVHLAAKAPYMVSKQVDRQKVPASNLGPGIVLSSKVPRKALYMVFFTTFWCLKAQN